MCGDFPCPRIKSLNKNYTTRYKISLIENGRRAGEDMDAFIADEQERFLCVCGGIIDMHNKKCSECGADKEDSR